MLICPEMMHDIFDELMVTRTTNLNKNNKLEVYYNKDVMILHVYAAAEQIE